MINFYSKACYGFEDLVALVRMLRAPDGCPWDSVQTHNSIRRNFIEEVYETCEAIDTEDTDGLREELGDVLLHVVFHASIEEDAGHFTIHDVCDTVVKKMISRHPSLFGGDADLDWDELKRREKGQTSLSEELDSVARSLPALWRAEKLQTKAEKSGYPVTPTSRQSASEVSESPDKLRAVGDMLFDTVCLARKLGVDPEQALNQSCDAFLAQVRRNETGRDIPKIQADTSAQYVKE